MSGNIWFTADTHFGHANIIRHANRPFKTVDEMDDAMIASINTLVHQSDILYHLGDWSFQDPVKYRRMVNCQHIVLILGNHDHRIRRHPHHYYSLFSIHSLGLEIKAGGQDITLCHYAMKVWNKSHHGAWHLYGHSHGTLPEDPNSLSFDVGVDCWGYKPISFDEVRAKMATKTFKPVDRHGTNSRVEAVGSLPTL